MIVYSRSLQAGSTASDYYTAILPSNLALAETIETLGGSLSTTLVLDPAFIEFLRNHLIIGSYDIDDFEDGTVVTTLSGLSLPVMAMGGEVRIGNYQILPESVFIGSPLLVRFNLVKFCISMPFPFA